MALSVPALKNSTNWIFQCRFGPMIDKTWPSAMSKPFKFLNSVVCHWWQENAFTRSTFLSFFVNAFLSPVFWWWVAMPSSGLLDDLPLAKTPITGRTPCNRPLPPTHLFSVTRRRLRPTALRWLMYCKRPSPAINVASIGQYWRKIPWQNAQLN